jgi:hypothetical protein
MKRILAGFLAYQLAAAPAFAVGYSNFAVPTQIDVERAGGFTIYGPFGNPGGCTNAQANKLYVRADHPQYNRMYAMALAAFATKSRIQAYVVTCQTITWYMNAPDTMNIVDSNSVLNIAD